MTLTTRNPGAFGEVLGELMRVRGLEPTPENVRDLAERAGFDPDALEQSMEAVEDLGPLTGLDHALSLDVPQMKVLATAYTFEKGGADDARRASGPYHSDRPDVAGIVRRGDAVGFKSYVERYGEVPACRFGCGHGEGCERPSVMEVYGLPMCREHGEEAASAALAELGHHVEQELERPLNAHVRALSPELEHALRSAGERIAEVQRVAEEVSERTLLAAFPLDRERVSGHTNAYLGGWDDRSGETPLDMFMHHRHEACYFMHVAFEKDTDWLVEMLERERAQAAEQAAYALALEREAGCR